MPTNIPVPDLGAKIDLLLRTERKGIRSNSALSKLLEIQADYLSRLKNGTRLLTEQKFLELCDTFGVTQKEWFEELEVFGERLGFSRKQIASISGKPLPGIDFLSRIRDKGIVNGIFDMIEGYWESFYYSVSRTDKRVISSDLLIVRRINDDEYIECEIIDGSFTYSGWCFPIKSHLYFVLEKAALFTEIIVYATNMPDRQPPRLYGVILCLSGGVEETSSYPSAAKAAFRYIGKDEKAREKYNIDPSENVEDFLKKTIPRYVDPEEEKDEETRKIFKIIANNIIKIPFALRMKI